MERSILIYKVAEGFHPSATDLDRLPEGAHDPFPPDSDFLPDPDKMLAIRAGIKDLVKDLGIVADSMEVCDKKSGFIADCLKISELDYQLRPELRNLSPEMPLSRGYILARFAIVLDDAIAPEYGWNFVDTSLDAWTRLNQLVLGKNEGLTWVPMDNLMWGGEA